MYALASHYVCFMHMTATIHQAICRSLADLSFSGGGGYNNYCIFVYSECAGLV